MLLDGEVMAESGQVVRTPTQGRLGNSARFSVDVLQLLDGALNATKCDIDVEHRNLHEDTWTVAGSFTQLSSTGVASLDLGDLRQLVRLSVEASGDDGGRARILVLPPSWKDS